MNRPAALGPGRRWLRAAAGAGAAWGLAGSLFLGARSVDETFPALLHDPLARHGDIVYAALACALYAAVIVLVGTGRAWRPLGAAAVAALALAASSAAAEAIVLSAEPNALVALLLLVVPPLVLVVAGVAGDRLAAGDRALGIGLVAAALTVSAVLDVFVVRDPYREALVFAGARAHWHPVLEVEHAVVDAAGNVWGVRPWGVSVPGELFRRDARGRFVRVEARPHGWPPTVVGVDGSGATWLASSDLDDPFEPVFEVFRGGRLERLPAPPRPLPPLDAVAVDPSAERVLGLHSNFRVPASMVLEVYEGGRWRTEATPIHVRGRAGLVDRAVDAEGRAWVWHAGEPARLYVLDDRWRAVDLGFEIAPTDDLGLLSVGMDAYETFLRGPGGGLWVHDAAGARLVSPDLGGGARPGAVALPDDCAPHAYDRAGRVWCGVGDGLRIVDASGAVLYDSYDAGLPRLRVESVSVGPEEAWVRVRRGEARQLLRFDHAAALAAP